MRVQNQVQPGKAMVALVEHKRSAGCMKGAPDFLGVASAQEVSDHAERRREGKPLEELHLRCEIGNAD